MTQISFAVTAKLISAFVFATRIVQSLYFLNTKFNASRHFLWLYSLVCVGPGRKPRRPVFSERGSYVTVVKTSVYCIGVLSECLTSEMLQVLTGDEPFPGGCRYCFSSHKRRRPDTDRTLPVIQDKSNSTPL